MGLKHPPHRLSEYPSMTQQAIEKPVVLTCAQPTGKLHLGNYLGAVRHWTGYLDSHECYFGLVDLHAITLPYTPATLRQNSYRCLAQYIACGLDPAKCHMFMQSHIIGHTELAWILGCLTPIGQLERMTQFKDKVARQQGGFIGAGLLYYPVLMAADILLYNADQVPVGEDQKQHLELTRDLAERFNRTYSDTFKVPEAVIADEGARIMSLQDPTRKMSKSDPNQAGVLYLVDAPDIQRKKIMSAVTDSDRTVAYRPDKAGICNLLNIFSAATGRPVGELESAYRETGYAAFKAAVADAVIAMLEPIRERYIQLEADRKTLDGVLAAGAKAAQRRASRMLSKVMRKAGFIERPIL